MDVQSTVDIKELNERIRLESSFVDIINMEMGKVIVGQKHLVESLLVGLLANGHILLEGVPGLAKTLAINTLANIIDVKFNRIQFTPDLLPADLIGTLIYSQKSEQFIVKKGPIFSNFILADEINRAPAKVQSALLEAMQERQVTIGDETFELEEPFLVLATQNPIEQEGTYPLPEAQVDRFMLKVKIDYPKLEEERQIMRENLAKKFPKAEKVLKPSDIIKAREVVHEVYMDEKIEKYILDIVFATRFPQKYNLERFEPMISYGASPRATISLGQASKAYAFIKRRGYVIPEDVRAVCYDVLRHRIGLTYEAEAENITSEDIITEILNTIEVP
ncbi:MAG: MoxR-like ATPase [Tenuifilum sp.]|jgi:MoxR-like ATPase|uniref:AAA family ATPase n=1 Tax=Tenuifilum sp. TaxID=2760880 RepID=UPI0024AB1BA6|nr:AAA family ATPase [Tenuifilum sp.]MDI3527642.1 MoxR-like ATPase [Tenuifilum sp.]